MFFWVIQFFWGDTIFFWDTIFSGYIFLIQFFRKIQNFLGIQKLFLGYKMLFVDQNPKTSQKLSKYKKKIQIFLFFDIFFVFSCLSDILI